MLQLANGHPGADWDKLINATPAERFNHDFGSGLESNYVGQSCFSNSDPYAHWRIIGLYAGDGKDKKKIDIIPTGATEDDPGTSPEHVAAHLILRLEIVDNYSAMKIRDDDPTTKVILESYDCVAGQRYTHIPGES